MLRKSGRVGWSLHWARGVLYYLNSLLQPSRAPVERGRKAESGLGGFHSGPSRGRSRGALNLGLNCLSSRLTGVNRDRLTGAQQRLTPIYDGAATGPVENDAPRAAQAPKTEQRSFQNSSAQTRARPAPQPFFTCAASPQPAHEARAPPPPPAPQREPAADRSPLTINTQDDVAQRRRRGRHRQRDRHL